MSYISVYDSPAFLSEVLCRFIINILCIPLMLYENAVFCLLKLSVEVVV
jgi:hypothetical protein